MVARLSQLIILAQLIAALATAWLINLATGVHPLAAVFIGGVAVIVLRFVITANNFLICYRHRSAAPRWRQLNGRELVSVLLKEFYATMIASSRDMPFRRFHTRLAEQPTTLPVLLIHGYGCNSGYWHKMSGVLAQAGVPHTAADLEPLFCGIEEYVPQVQRLIDDLCEQTGSRKIILLGHSMGGLVARAYLRACGAENVAGVITLGTPHHGTVLAKFGAGINSRQMRRWIPGHQRYGNPWLEALTAAETGEIRRLIVSIYTHHDNIIAPQTSSYLPGAKNRALRGIGHVALGSHPAVIRLTLREIRRLSQQRHVSSLATTTPNAESVGINIGR